MSDETDKLRAEISTLREQLAVCQADRNKAIESAVAIANAQKQIGQERDAAERILAREKCTCSQNDQLDTSIHDSECAYRIALEKETTL